MYRKNDNCVRLSLHQQVIVAVFVPSQPATWSYHAADCQPTAPVRSVSLVQSAGMPYRIILSRQQIFRSMFLNTSLKRFHFVDTDTSTTVAH